MDWRAILTGCTINCRPDSAETLMMPTTQAPAGQIVPIHEYVRQRAGVFSRLAHGWELHSAVLLTPAEERTMVREPAQAVPQKIAERLGPLRILVAPYIGCFKSGDAVCFSKPEGETHTAVWVESDGRTCVVLASKELDAHDTGFEFLASVAHLLVATLNASEMQSYSELLANELSRKVSGEIDPEALEAKQKHLRPAGGSDGESGFAEYRETSLVSTLAEYMHGLWHDVQVRAGPEHLPVRELQNRMMLLAKMFPPNPGYSLFARELESQGEQG